LLAGVPSEEVPMDLLPRLVMVALLLASCQSTYPVTVEQEGEAQVLDAPDLADFQRIAHEHLIGIPDGDPGGVLIGPLRTRRDGQVIREVLLEVQIEHPCGGDVSMHLYFDADNDGIYEVETPLDLYLARQGSFRQPPRWSCEVQLRGKYFFRHGPDVENLERWDAGSLAGFEGWDKGGSFYLRAVDSSEGDVGTLASCTVHVR
jgi:hypothetical protein